MPRTYTTRVVRGMILIWFALTASMSYGWGEKSEAELVSEADKFIVGKPEKLQRFFHSLYMEGEWNAVLNFNLLGLAAIEEKRFDISQIAFDQAAARIMKIYAGDENAEKALSLWSEESVKDFKGEPYERAMAFYYRGLLYLNEGDFQNARAAFLQADFQNSIGQGERYASSFSLAKYLAAWSSHCDGDTARADDLVREIMDSVRAQRLGDRYFARSSYPMGASLIVVESGLGPDKWTKGEHADVLFSVPLADVTGQVEILFREEPLRYSQEVAANIDFLAMTRGGRPIDYILAGKAQFKETAASVSSASADMARVFYDTLTSLGPNQVSNAKALASIGLGSSALSAFSGALSNSTKASADTRYWASLPKKIHLATAAEMNSAPSGFKTQNGKRKRQFSIVYTSEACNFYWGREYSGLARADGGSGNPAPWPAEPIESGRRDVNLAFRASLESLF